MNSLEQLPELRETFTHQITSSLRKAVTREWPGGREAGARCGEWAGPPRLQGPLSPHLHVFPDPEALQTPCFGFYGGFTPQAQSMIKSLVQNNSRRIKRRE